MRHRSKAHRARNGMIFLHFRLPQQRFNPAHLSYNFPIIPYGQLLKVPGIVELLYRVPQFQSGLVFFRSCFGDFKLLAF